MSKKILMAFEPKQFEQLSQNHIEYVSEKRELITLQEYIRRILAKEQNKLQE